MNYLDLKQKKQKRFDDFMSQYGGFAFSDEQFEKQLEKLNAEPKDLVSIGLGGFILKSKQNEFMEIIEDETISNQIKNDDELLYQAIFYELGNHEYIISIDREEAKKTIFANLDLTEEELKNERISKIIKKATKDYMKEAINEN